MAFQIPTLPELVERARQSFRAHLPGSDAWIWPNNLNVAAKVKAGLVFENFLWLKYIEKQRFVTTADGEFLEKHAQQYGISRLPASFAAGSGAFTGTPAATVPAGLIVQRTDGFRYEVTAAAIIDGNGDVTVSLRALEAGAAGNALAGAGLALVSGFAGLNNQGAVAAGGIGLGADEESDESLRSRILHRLQFPPHGGAAHDYVAWAREIAGVTRVFVEPLADGPGTVHVYFLMDDLYTDGIPQGADVAAVQAYINEVRPVTAVVSVIAPTPQSVDITITGLSPDTTAVRDAVKAELTDLFRRSVQVGTDSAPFTLYRSKVWEAISQAAGEDHHVLTVPASDVEYDGGTLPVLGTVTFA